MAHYIIPEGADLPALARQIIANQIEANRKLCTGGVGWSAMGPTVPEVPEYDALLARLEAQVARHAAWAKSPRGRLYGAIRELEEVGYVAESHRLEGEYRPLLQDEREPLNTASVGACLTILESIPARLAKAAREALAEMLMSEAPALKAAA